MKNVLRGLAGVAALPLAYIGFIAVVAGIHGIAVGAFLLAAAVGCIMIASAGKPPILHENRRQIRVGYALAMPVITALIVMSAHLWHRGTLITIGLLTVAYPLIRMAVEPLVEKALYKQPETFDQKYEQWKAAGAVPRVIVPRREDFKSEYAYQLALSKQPVQGADVDVPVAPAGATAVTESKRQGTASIVALGLVAVILMFVSGLSGHPLAMMLVALSFAGFLFSQWAHRNPNRSFLKGNSAGWFAAVVPLVAYFGAHMIQSPTQTGHDLIHGGKVIGTIILVIMGLIAVRYGLKFWWRTSKRHIEEDMAAEDRMSVERRYYEYDMANGRYADAELMVHQMEVSSNEKDREWARAWRNQDDTTMDRLDRERRIS